MRRSFALALLLVGACSFERATIVRNVGIGVTAEGALVTGGAFVTRDSGEGISDAVITAAPLLATGIVLWVAGEIMRGIAGPAPARR
ncbi:MAG: hypothetical protein AB7T06_33780 [Kofleriaceae bacterium]